MNIEIITAPLIGGLIGLITNGLAIKMLFRPYEEKYIGKLKLPFTPGLIPKEKARIAAAIGKVIAEYILDQQTLTKALASVEIKAAYEEKIEKYLKKWENIDCSLEEFLENKGWTDGANVMETKLRETIGIHLVKVCQEEELSRKLIDHAYESIKANMNPILYKIGKGTLEDTRIDMIDYVDQLLEDQGAEYIGKTVDGIYLEWLDKPVSQLVAGLKGQVPNLKEVIWDKYEQLIKEKAGSFLATLNISGIIEKKIMEYDLKELEQMIMEIARNELNALVLLGGLLGMLMGILNIWI